jgi:hypothetical protein
MGALLFPMHRMPCIATVIERCSEINQSIAGSYVFTLEGNAWRPVTKLVLLSCTPVELTFAYACSWRRIQPVDATH